MATNSFVTVSNLTRFKTLQDEANLAKFASLENGVVKADQLPSYVDDVIEGYAVDNAGTITIYKEAAHTTAITGETGKIYVDIGSTPAKTYRWSGSAYIEIGSAASTADRATNDSDGNPINTTYVKNSQKATTSSYGIVQVGTNIGVTDGVISVATATGSALGVAKGGTNITVNNGAFDVATATGSTLGVAKAGTNVTANNGAFDVATGTTSNLGVLKVGSNIAVTDGTISIGSSQVVAALGYTPVDASTFATDSDIDGLFA